MSKIQFTLDAWLENKSQKVETRSGKNVRIICWDKIGVPIVAMIGDAEDIVTYNRDGTTGQEMRLPSDLFIITPEPELSEFEKRIRFTIDEVVDGRYNADNIDDVKGLAKGLLILARDQFIKDGYVIEKKAFHDAAEKVAPEVMKEVSDKVDMEEALRLEYEKGRADALNDLPRWKTLKDGDYNSHVEAYVGTNMIGEKTLYVGNKCISINKLKKLPGFKEDEKWK